MWKWAMLPSKLLQVYRLSIFLSSLNLLSGIIYSIAYLPLLFASSIYIGWMDELLPITKDHVDWISLYHDYSTDKNYSKAIWMGLPNGYGNTYEYWQGNMWAGLPYDDTNPKKGNLYYYNPYVVVDKIAVIHLDLFLLFFSFFFFVVSSSTKLLFIR